MAVITGLVARVRRSDAVLSAIRTAIEKRKNTINNEPGVRSLTVVVKFKNGTDVPRVVLTTIETEDEIAEKEG